MKKLTLALALLGATTAFGLVIDATDAKAYSTVIYDAAAISPTYSRIEKWTGSTSNDVWGDELGGNNGFRSSGIGVDWGFTGNAISSVTFTLYTNFGLAGTTLDGQYIGFADLFIDLGDNGTFDNAIDFHSEGTGPSQTSNFAQLVTVAGNFSTSVDIFGSTNLSYGGRTNVCGADTNAACDAGSRAPETRINGNSTYSLAVSDGGNGTLDGPNGDPNYTYSYSVVLSGIDFTGWDTLRLFWGTGWCSNDSIEGYASIPVPAALPILGAALAGFGFAGWRQRKAA